MFLDAFDAVSAWAAAVPELKYTQVAFEASADIVFKNTLLHGCTGLSACTDFVDWDYDNHRRASILLKVEIGIDLTLHWSSDGIKAVLVHELGHVYGLHERYVEAGGPCNTTEVSIMDAVTGNPVVHCDGITGPAAVDVSRVDSYWSTGYIGNMAGLKDPDVPTRVNWTWNDFAWAEWVQLVHFYWWNETYWQEYALDSLGNADYLHRIGVHIDNVQRNRTTSLDRTAFGIPPYKWHSVCADVYFKAFDIVGTETCVTQGNYVLLGN